LREQVKYPIHTATIGLALLEQRQALPSILNYRRESAQRQVCMGQIRSNQINLDQIGRQEVSVVSSQAAQAAKIKPDSTST
jgi:hypothetical protein